MPNINGLISSRDVAYTGDVDSNIFLRVGEPIASPLIIESPDGSEHISIVVANTTGNVVIANTDGNITVDADANVVINGDLIQLVGNSGVQVKPNTQANTSGTVSLYNGTGSAKPVFYTTYCGGVSTGGLTTGNLQTFGYSGASYATIRKCLDIDPEGDAVGLGDGQVVGGCVVNVNGSLGASRVYDRVYNPPPAPVIPPAGVSLTNLLSVGTPSATNAFALPSAGTWLVTGNLTLQGISTTASGLIQVIASGTSVTDIPVPSLISSTLSIPFTTFIVGNSMSLTASMGGLTAIGGSGQQFIWWSYQKMA